MTLAEALGKRGLLYRGNKVACMFHGDHNPSAIFNGNNIYCFVCGKAYSYLDIGKRLGVQINFDSSYTKIKNDNPEYLFYYFGDWNDYTRDIREFR